MTNRKKRNFIDICIDRPRALCRYAARAEVCALFARRCADYAHDLVCVPVMVMTKLNVAKLATSEGTLSVKVAVMFEARLRMEFSRSHVNVAYFCVVVGFQCEVLMFRHTGIVPVFLI
jgi:hypothetical protein